jgi:hypothetical protein
MTPKEKAEDLFITFYQRYPDVIYTDEGAKIEAKFCALFCVDEILNNYYKNHFKTGKKIDYWIEVKNELNKL